MPSTILDESNTSLQRSLSDISLEKSKDVGKVVVLTAIEEEEEVARCECCGLSEECTLEYKRRVRERFSGKIVCGLCGEAVKEEMDKNGGNRDEAVEDHMRDCMRFNTLDRAYPVLYQAHVMREIFKSRCNHINNKGGKGGIARTSTCIPPIARSAADRTLVK